ncbi:exopolyphosphatase PRUNE1-like [Clytia hemisphaerica]|uniref:DHHA2 domain-containing protein n=1 Tax=Clytia hemisphaerica TaxID=252671 RepID=A0A7M5UQ96_9CNID
MEDMNEKTQHGLRNYLQKFKEIDFEEVKSIELIVGNESADLDSIVCPLVLAYYRSCKINIQIDESNSICLPVVWCHKDDVELTTEAVALFKDTCLPIKDLLFQNDWEALKEKFSHKDLKVTLVDHNHAREHPDLNEFVVEIIDHRIDTNDFTNISKKIQLLGSCSSIIAQWLHQTDSEFLVNSPDVCKMLLATILVDTYNLDLHSGRTTEQDIFIAELLSSYIEDVDTDELFTKLQKAKMDISSMSTYNILRKDYKCVQKKDEKAPNVGISSAVIEGSIFISRKDFLENVLKHMNLLKLDVLMIMFLHFNKGSTEPIRQILLVSESNNLRLKIEEFMLQEQDLNLMKNDFILSEELRKIAILYGHNPKWSRKKVMPVMSGFTL